jgi:hypothetical protein
VWREVKAIDIFTPQVLLQPSTRVHTTGNSGGRKSWHPVVVKAADEVCDSDGDGHDRGSAMSQAQWVKLGYLVQLDAVVLRGNSLDKPPAAMVAFALPKSQPTSGLKQLHQLLKSQR